MLNFRLGDDMDEDQTQFAPTAIDAALDALDELSKGHQFCGDDLIAAAYALDYLALQSDDLRRIASDPAFAGSTQGTETAQRVARLLREVRRYIMPAASATLH
ncbi:hypothetical protein [Methylobacterium radiotolerans]|uniref:Uncharacterized protein n=1 Tax=Methylobacterium radiotolerans (strain ATCC 27329 / DSM 1819 / JCM 2831 / NBRC 15690 / NCIMB 10815 / 0-1) TaxID=426355 RepID=B1M9U3_METRJ|nr:hypothetical protein [Methylobacterium radiotolerans]ACB28268.1 hypothetical protein Mrad2831_6346 [Methylobacterium radiotolerans JCM 2831]GEN01408.1 hypothetical protein MRA01_59470 [Methylobacterium radiotolerans]